MPNKRKSKKRNTNQGTTDSVSQSDATLTNKENIDPTFDSVADTPPALSTSPTTNQESLVDNIPAGGPVGIGAKGAVLSNIAPDTTETINPNADTTLPLPDFIQTAIDNVVGARVIDTEAIIGSVKEKVANGDYKETAKPTTTAKVQQANAPQPIGETNAFETTSIGEGVPLGAPAAIVTKSSPATNEAANPPASLTEKVHQANTSTLPIASGDTNAAETTSIGEGVPLGAPAAIVSSSSRAISDPNDHPVSLTSELASAGPIKKVAAAVTGAGAAAAGATKLEETKLENLSESVQHGIRSVVNSTVVDIDKIIRFKSFNLNERPAQQDEPKKSQDIKRPEAAIGEPNQPAMPSSAKTADNPVAAQAKSKSSEHKPSFLKKKNCIIL